MSSLSDILKSIIGDGPDLIYYHVLPTYAQAIVIMTQVLSAFFGITVFDLIVHLPFDVRLLFFSKGWTEPLKAMTRFNYLICRYSSPALLICTIIFLSIPISDCGVFIKAIDAMTMVNLNSVSLIFVHRTIALWEWEMRVVLPLFAAWLGVLGVSIVVLHRYGQGVRIPDSNFCIFDTDREKSKGYTLTYKVLSLSLDFIIMCLTLHRLLEGGLTGLLTGKGRHFVGSTPLSRTIARQGFQIFCLQVCVDVLFFILYWSFPKSQTPFQMAGSAMIFCLPSLLAGKAFRDARKVLSTDASGQGSSSEPRSATDSHLNSVAKVPLSFQVHEDFNVRREVQLQQERRHAHFGADSVRRSDSVHLHYLAAPDNDVELGNVANCSTTRILEEVGSPTSQSPLPQSHQSQSSHTSKRTVAPHFPTNMNLTGISYDGHVDQESSSHGETVHDDPAVARDYPRLSRRRSHSGGHPASVQEQVLPSGASQLPPASDTSSIDSIIEGIMSDSPHPHVVHQRFRSDPKPAQLAPTDDHHRAAS